MIEDMKRWTRDEARSLVDDPESVAHVVGAAIKAFGFVPIGRTVALLRPAPAAADDEPAIETWEGEGGAPAAAVTRRCCELDDDGDGNCQIHSAPGVFRRRTA